MLSSEAANTRHLPRGAVSHCGSIEAAFEGKKLCPMGLNSLLPSTPLPTPTPRRSLSPSRPSENHTHHHTGKISVRVCSSPYPSTAPHLPPFPSYLKGQISECDIAFTSEFEDPGSERIQHRMCCAPTHACSRVGTNTNPPRTKAMQEAVGASRGDSRANRAHVAMVSGDYNSLSTAVLGALCRKTGRGNGSCYTRLKQELKVETDGVRQVLLPGEALLAKRISQPPL